MTSGGVDFTVRPGRPDDLPAILELLTLCLGTGTVPRTATFWRWKHEENPFGASPVLLAETDGRLVGLRTFLRWRWRSGDRDVHTVRAVDTATHPDWRGRGVFSRLTRCLLEEVTREGTAFVFNTPNRASGAGYRKMGWRTVGQAPVMVRPLRPARAALRFLSPPVAPDLSAFPSAVELLDAPILDELLETLQDDSVEQRYHTRVDRDYLRWRYGSPPELEYQALWSDRAEAPAAVVFRGRRRGRFREGVVTEVLAAPGEAARRAASELLRQLAASADADTLVAVAAPATPERRSLREAGFVPLPLAGPRLVVRTLTPMPSLPDPTRVESWRLSAGGLELF